LIHSLQESGVYNDVDVRALKLDTIPIDTDLVSMELPDSFMDLIIRGSESVLKPMAQTLLKLQVLFGPFPTVQCIGRNARSLYTLTKSLSPSSFPLSVLAPFPSPADSSLAVRALSAH
jgi:vacuolar protein sorting-associated protein 33B